MKDIKTRNSVRSIKTLDKSIGLPKRLKNTLARTKKSAEETQEPHNASPTDYAVENTQHGAQGLVRETVHHLPNSRHKGQGNPARVKRQFNEAEHKTGFERGGVSNVDLNNNDFTMKDKMLRFRKAYSQQNSCVENGGVKSPETILTTSVKPVDTHTGNGLHGDVSNPGYLRKGVTSQKSPADTANSMAKKSAKAFKPTTKGFKATTKTTVKTTSKTAKEAVKAAKQTAKATQKTAKAAAKAAKAAEKAARAAAKAAAQTAKAVIKAVIALVKAAIAAIKSLIAAIAAGGWTAVVVILVICLIGLLIGSIFGIFFSSEPDPYSGQTINSVIMEINTEFTEQIEAIINNNAHDYLDMSGARATWKQVLAVYTVRTVSDPDKPMEVATMTDEKAFILWTTFWEMNAISYASETFEAEKDILDDDDKPTGETITVTYTVLRITVSHKTADEMAAQYGFTDEQNEWLEELLKTEYSILWNALLYGISSIGDGVMIEIADTQIGNAGGETYWSWYGLSNRDEWCAIFVSWVAEQCGYIEADVIPKFASCRVGIQWFKDRGQWMERDYTPAPGDLIFFDWEPDGVADHVGIVEYVADGKVNTIEGNSSDSVRRRSYDFDSIKIFGYGVPIYT